nr:hypothetical protein [uncultured Rhodoferax sp.]
MKSIQENVAALSISDARSALYYLSRHLKQASHFKDYRKDVFEDTQRSAPSQAVRQATLEMIKFIEECEGMPASNFDDPTYTKWASFVQKVENSLDPELTESDLARARKFLDEFGLPNSEI